MTGVPTVFFGNIVHCLDYKTLEIITDGVVGIDSNGTIILVDKATGVDEALDKFCEASTKHGITAEDKHNVKVVTGTKNQFIFPGFFDTHVHASQFPNAGIFGETTLLDWLDKYTFPLESKFSDVEKAKQVYETVVEKTLANGTTMASYYGTIHIPGTVELAQTCIKSGQRALVGRVCMERFCPDALVDKDPAQKDREFVKLVRDLNSELVAPILTPRFAPSCTSETLAEQGKIAEELDVQVQTHISENDKEIAWIEELFPEADSYADVYRKAGLLRKGAIYAHCIHLTDPERKLFMEHGCGISHCPISNLAIGSGIAPVLRLLEEGQRVSLGTDVSGGYSPSILVNARQAIMMSRELARTTGDDSHKLQVEHVLYLATLGGAAVCDREEDLGNFVVGKKFDAQLVDITSTGSQIDTFDWNMPIDPAERTKYLATKWLYLGDDRNTTKVWVNGQLVVNKN